MIRPINIGGSDSTMDHPHLLAGGPGLNPLPTLCTTCGFPDIDAIPTPYFLFPPRALSNHELSLAEMGNLFVKERVKRTFDLVIPDLCTFHPTFFQNSERCTAWYLAVPRRFGSTGSVRSDIPRCPDCGQPASAHPGSQYASRTLQSCYDLAKALNWASDENGWKRWLRRPTLLSVRLYALLKCMNVQWFHEATGGRQATPPTDAERAWVQMHRDTLQQHDLLERTISPPSTNDLAWLETFLESAPRARKPVASTSSVPVPPSYARLLDSVGLLRFRSIDCTDEGVSLFPPSKWRNFQYRDDASIDQNGPRNAVIFASTPFGNYFCFDLDSDSAEPPVWLYRHESDTLEPYADNFIHTLERFVGAVS